MRLTRKLIDALALIDVRVLDHLIVGQGGADIVGGEGVDVVM